MPVSYVDKKKTGKKNIVVLTTMHTSVSVTKDQRVKPNVHTFYDHTKGEVDVVDLVSTHNTTKMKNRRWPINALAFVLDTVRTNAKTILAKSSNPATLSSIEFTYTLGKLLVLPHMQGRYQDSSNSSTVLVHKMRQGLGIQIDKPRNLPTANTARCSVCVDYITGADDYKLEREKLNNNLKNKCSKCSQIIFKYHMKSICEKCEGV